MNKKQAYALLQKENSETIENWINGGKPEKCVSCLEIGMRSCRWWLSGYQCEHYQGDRLTEQLKAIFGKKKKVIKKTNKILI